MVEREQCLILESEHPQLKEEMFRCLMEQYVWEWPQLYLVIRFVDTASAAASLPQTKNSTEEVAQELLVILLESITLHHDFPAGKFTHIQCRCTEMSMVDTLLFPSKRLVI